MPLADHIKKDSPTNNFATWNPIHFTEEATPDIADISVGNLVASVSSSTCAFSTFQFPKSGKWFVEIHLVAASGPQVGLGTKSAYGQGNETGFVGVYNSNNMMSNGINLALSSGSLGMAAAHTVLIAVDSDLGKVYIGNNTSISSGSSGSYMQRTSSTVGALASFDPAKPTFSGNGGGGFYTSNYVDSTYFDINEGWFIFVSGGGPNTWHLNAGQDHTFGGITTSSGNSGGGGIGLFHTIPPVDASGTSFKALCTANLPDFTPTVDNDNPEDYMRPFLITGSNVNQTVDIGFQPDLCWFIKRSGAGHMIMDSVRGAGYGLQSNNTGAQPTAPTANKDFKEFTTTGFDLGPVSDYASSNTLETGVSDNIITWNWKAGGAPSGSNIYMKDGTPYTDVSDTALFGSASNYTNTPTSASIGVKQGFSIIEYASSTNTTVPHGLNSAPDLIICKNLDSTFNWDIYHSSLSYSGIFTNAAITSRNAFGSVNSNIFTTVDTYTSNGSDTYIAYCWHNVEGYSKFDSYIGDGSTTYGWGAPEAGPFVFTGFKPAHVWIKCISASTTTNTGWAMYDNARDPHNAMSKVLYANKNVGEGKRGDGTSAATDIEIDFLSNGFRIVSDRVEINDDGETYIFCAWAEMPQKYAVAR